ncbi:MAG: guanine deaminase [Pseudomonadota bacterium]
MSDRLIRGRTLSFRRRPEGPSDLGALAYEEDGALLIREGRIVASGPFDCARGLPIDDHRGHLVLPGLIDAHLHMPQMRVMASWGTELLDWLSRYTFPEEARCVDPAHAARMARAFFDSTLRNGTTTVAAFCTSHPASAEAFFTESARRGLRVIGGKVMMDQGAPEALLDTADRAHDETEALIRRWHGVGRAEVGITPRFAITSSPAQLAAAGALAAAHPSCPVQTHLSENHAEVALAARLHPNAPDYFGIYEAHGLAGPRSLFGHCLHLTERERAAMAETGSVAVFCPTSNLFLGSGLFDMAGLEAAGLRTAIATDIGGGTSPSLLRTLAEAYKVLALQGQRMDPLTAFWRATRGNAEALGLGNRIGSLEPGIEADVVVLDPRATPEMALRHETVESLAEELFLLQTLGDDRAVRAVYAAGEPLLPAP